MKNHEEYMRQAIALSKDSIKKGAGPFGAVIVKDGEVIAATHNHVAIKNDPTAHAEVEAIRMATQKLGTFDLHGCEIYTSCEPCPMCLGAIYWARLDKIYYANDKNDAKDAGFDDSFIYEEIDKAPALRKVEMIRLLGDEAKEGFRMWMDLDDKIEY